MEKSKKDDFSKIGRGLYGLSSLSFERLIRLKENNEQHEFNKIIQQVLPDVNGYIARRLSTAVKNGILPSGKYKVEDFTNEIYYRAFEQINELEDERQLLPWLFEKADEMLSHIETDEKFNKDFFENIDNYTSKEWKQMRADFSTDGDGDLMLLEEFDDPSYPRYEYELDDVFVEENPEQEWLDKIHATLSDNDIHRQVDLVLHQLPAQIRSIYNLAVHQRFKPYEIAKIKRISVYQVEQCLTEARKAIILSLKKNLSH